MEKILMIDGKPVAFRATAAAPRLYRLKFKRDILQDMAAIQKGLEKAEETGGLSVESLEMFEDVAYIMAKHAAPEAVPKSVEAWLDGFDTFSIYQIFPEIVELWQANMETAVEAKKKPGPPPGK